MDVPINNTFTTNLFATWKQYLFVPITALLHIYVLWSSNRRKNIKHIRKTFDNNENLHFFSINKIN